MKNEYTFGMAFVSFGFLILLISTLFIFSNSSNLTGRAITKEVECEDGEILLDDECVPAGTCRSGECNPNNIDEICVGEKWSLCGDGKVCSLGNCVVPVEVKGNAFIRGGGINTESGSSSSVQNSVVVNEVIRSIGEIGGDVIEKVQKDEKLIFLIDGKEISIKVIDIMVVEVKISFNGDLVSFSVGEEKEFDFDIDGINDFGIILKSVGIVDNSAKFLIKKI